MLLIYLIQYEDLYVYIYIYKRKLEWSLGVQEVKKSRGPPDLTASQTDKSIKINENQWTFIENH